MLAILLGCPSAPHPLPPDAGALNGQAAPPLPPRSLPRPPPGWLTPEQAGLAATGRPLLVQRAGRLCSACATVATAWPLDASGWAKVQQVTTPVWVHEDHHPDLARVIGAALDPLGGWPPAVAGVLDGATGRALLIIPAHDAPRGRADTSLAQRVLAALSGSPTPLAQEAAERAGPANPATWVAGEPPPGSLAGPWWAWRAALTRGAGGGDASALAGLTALCRSPLHDPAGGGFYRGSASRQAAVPAPEKRAADAAQLLEALADALAVAPSPLWRDCAQSTTGFLSVGLVAPAGSADHGTLAPVFLVDGLPERQGSGTSQTWTQEEVMAALGPVQAPLIWSGMGLGKGCGPLPGLPGRVLPCLAAAGKDAPAADSEPRRRWAAAAATRHPLRGLPSTTAASAMAARALLSVPHLAGARGTAVAAAALSDLVASGMGGGDEMPHLLIPTADAGPQPWGRGTLLDQATTVRALVMAASTTGEEEPLTLAVRLARGGLWRRLAEALRPGGPPGLGPSFTAGWPAATLALLADQEDPSPLAVAALALMDLADATGEASAQEYARALITLGAESLPGLPARSPSLALAARSLMATPVVVQLRRTRGVGAAPLVTAALAVRAPRLVIRHHLAARPDGGRPPPPDARVCAPSRCGPWRSAPADLTADVLAAAGLSPPGHAP